MSARDAKREAALKLHPATAQLLELFEYKHLPEHLQDISRPFHNLAWSVAQESTQRGAEQTTCLRKLLEAKDCAVRMKVPLGQIGSNSLPLDESKERPRPLTPSPLKTQH